MGLLNLTFPSYGGLKGGHTFLFSKGQIFCQKLLYNIVDLFYIYIKTIKNLNKRRQNF